MERILRSIIQIGNTPEVEEALGNWTKFQEFNLELSTEVDQDIVNFLKKFYDTYSSPPDFKIVKEFFQKSDKIDVVTRLDEIHSAQPYIRTNFLSLVRSYKDDQDKRNFTQLLRDAATIADSGKTIQGLNGKKEVLRGVNEASGYLFEGMSKFSRIESGDKLEGVLADDCDDVLQEYDVISKTNKFTNRNLTGFEPVDEACKGHKSGEYWIHCAFSGELKCVPGDAKIFDHKTNRRRDIKEIFESGDLPRVNAVYKEGELPITVFADTSHVVENGVRMVYTITLHSGRKVSATANHPFLTANRGWVELQNLVVGYEGDLLCVTNGSPVEFPVSGDETQFGTFQDWQAKNSIPGEVFGLYENDIIKLLAPLSGQLQDKSFTHESEEFLLDLQSLVLRLHIHSVVKKEKGHFRISFENDIFHGTCGEFLSETVYGLRADSIRSIKPRGEEMTYDISVPEHKSFVVNDVVSHNTTMALNYAYNNAFIYNKNIFYAILEMTYTNLRRQIYVIHSSHGKFVTDWYLEDKKRGISDEHCYRGIDYRKVRDGELSDIDLERFKKVAQDFKANCKGKLFVWRPEDEVKMSDIKKKSEMFHNKYGCDGLIIDYLGLVQPKHRIQDQLASVNSVVREGRMLALNFGRGRGVPLLSLFQMNRQGKMRADKNDGRYDYSAIAFANQIEKDADVITYTYLNDELRKDGKYYLGNLKNRDNPIFERMVGKILWNSKRMRSMDKPVLKLDDQSIIEGCNSLGLNMEDML